MTLWRSAKEVRILAGVIMRQVWGAVLFVVGCSSSDPSGSPAGVGGEAGSVATGGVAGSSGSAGASSGGAAGQIGTGGEGAVYKPPFECWDGCTPLSAFAVGSPPCQGLGQAECNAFPGAWVYSVPECGKPQMWVWGCTWVGYCAPKSLSERFQTCVK